MDQPVNFDNLRDITGGDMTLEAELFQIFMASSGECVAALRSACSLSSEEDWRKQAHALKGMCFNLGAARLGELCKKAQETSHATMTEKQQMLEVIEEELKRIAQFLKPYL